MKFFKKQVYCADWIRYNKYKTEKHGKMQWYIKSYILSAIIRGKDVAWLLSEGLLNFIWRDSAINREVLSGIERIILKFECERGWFSCSACSRILLKDGLVIGRPVWMDLPRCSSLRVLKALQVDPIYQALQLQHLYS